MIHFKNHKKIVALYSQNGFTFIELMLALFIMATSLSALFGLQNTIFTYLVRAYNRTSRMIIIKKNLMDRMLEIEEEGTRGTEYVEHPETKIDWSEKKIRPEGPYEGMQYLYLTQVKGSWKILGKEYKDTMIGISFRPLRKNLKKKNRRRKIRKLKNLMLKMLALKRVEISNDQTRI